MAHQKVPLDCVDCYYSVQRRVRFNPSVLAHPWALFRAIATVLSIMALATFAVTLVLPTISLDRDKFISITLGLAMFASIAIAAFPFVRKQISFAILMKKKLEAMYDCDFSN